MGPRGPHSRSPVWRPSAPRRVSLYALSLSIIVVVNHQLAVHLNMVLSPAVYIDFYFLGKAMTIVVLHDAEPAFRRCRFTP